MKKVIITALLKVCVNLGNSFKPFVYQVAINLGYSPMSEIADISRIFEGGAGNNEDWKPKNEGVNF